jgi:hypothetical protein
MSLHGSVWGGKHKDRNFKRPRQLSFSLRHLVFSAGAVHAHVAYNGDGTRRCRRAASPGELGVVTAKGGEWKQCRKVSRKSLVTEDGFRM